MVYQKKDSAEWGKWVKVLVTNNVFLDVFNDNKKMFDDKFAAAVDTTKNQSDA